MPEDLLHLQRWLARVVRHPARIGEAVADADALLPQTRVIAGDVIGVSERADALTRLAVYNGGYLARLRDALAIDFPGLAHALGDDAFLTLVSGYVELHPSRHPNLNQLGAHLPDYIAGLDDLQNRGFLVDLARLELAMTRAFDAPEFTPFDMSALQHLSEEQWAEVVLRTNPSLQVLAFDFPVNGWLQAFFDEAPIDLPRASPHWLAVYRQDYQVFRLGLPQAMFAILGALCDGQPFAKALEAGGEHEHDLSHWFQQWSADGLFIGADGVD